MTDNLQVQKLPIIGVMGSGRPMPGEELAAEAGRTIAEMGFHLLTGAGEAFMENAARAFCEVTGRKGLSIGIVPAVAFGSGRAPGGYPNPWVEVPIRTHLTRGVWPRGLRSRNTINVLTAAALIFLPGGKGTLSELRLARRFDRPRALYLGPVGTIDGRTAAQLTEFADSIPDLGGLRSYLSGFIGD